MGSDNPPSHSRGPSRVLLLVTLAFIGLAVYVLVITHHLKIDAHGLHLQAHTRSSGQGQGLAQILKRKPVDAEAANSFVNRMISIGAFSRYDVDKSGSLSQAEFESFLKDLAHSRILDPLALSHPGGVAADLVARARPGTGGGQQQQQPQQGGTSRGAQQPAVTTPKTEPAVGQTGSNQNTAVATTGPTTTTTPGTCPELTKELVASFARDSTIMLTVSDWRIFETFGVNWMKHLKRVGVDYYLVGATDAKTAEFLAGQGRHPCFKFFEDGHGKSQAHQEYKYGSSHYNAATWRKVVVVEQIVSWGFNVLHSDVDVVWFRDPLPYFLGPACKSVDMAVSTDLVSTNNQKGDDGLEVSIHQHVNMNTGVYFVKSTPGGRSFMAGWAGLRQSRSHDNDQFGLYTWLRGRPASVNHTGRYVQTRADENPADIRIGMLSVSMLLNGYSYFIPRLHTVQNVQPLGIHLTWVPLSREGKFHRMRDGGLYNDPPEYYSQPMFITGDLDFPATPPGYNDQKDTEAMIKFHLKAMDEQLTQMYRVMAVAVIMNRTIVFPKLQCFCYKNWFMMEQCRIPGDHATVFPMECQLDQWLRPKVLYNYGVNISAGDGSKRPFLFREHSLFNNTNFPKDLLPKEVVVRAADVKEPQVVAGAGGKRELLIPKGGLSQNKLKQQLEALGPDARIIRLKSPRDLLSGWDDNTLKASFEAFLDRVAGNWCCRDKPFIQKGLKEKEKLAIHW